MTLTSFVNKLIAVKKDFDIGNIIELKNSVASVRDSIVKSSHNYNLFFDKKTEFKCDFSSAKELVGEGRSDSDDNDRVEENSFNRSRFN